METMQELIPFVREVLGQRSARGMLKVYLVGTVFAVVGTVIGLVETVCRPFSSGESAYDADETAMLMLEQPRRTLVGGHYVRRRGRREQQQQQQQQQQEQLMEVEELKVRGATHFETDVVPATLCKTHRHRIAANDFMRHKGS
ncbi:hypothetical protein NHX12_029750 [Muraenolepis orangiensis]|uniref:G0/G1 switch protein 2 n=1 Tax=Muraenolepis orangiensis TaxID=630683 RepID=A0A9Q0IKD7_9TELE|nr:hypothetical protein NHX12_029750 [Muraenolepis orangiensis]